MIAECAIALCLAAAEPADRPPPLPRRVDVVRDTWAGSGDVGIPAWTPRLAGGRIHFRPETARAWRGECGRRARALARFIYWHEHGHAVKGIADEDAANAYAYSRAVGWRVEPLLPAYGTLLTTWRSLRPRCVIQQRGEGQ